jgi:hypothetical protein
MILADKSFFDLALRPKVGIDLVDLVTDQVAPVCSTTTILDHIEEQVNRLSPPQAAIWRDALHIMKKRYIRQLTAGKNYISADAEISHIAKEMTTRIRSLSAKVDRQEIQLLAAATWLRKNSLVEPIVVSDDGDVLRACHLFASFFGLVISVLSSFEVLRLSKETGLMINFCDHFSLDPPISRFIGTFESSGKFVGEVDTFAKRGFLSMHYLLPTNKTTVSIVTKSKIP